MYKNFKSTLIRLRKLKIIKCKQKELIRTNLLRKKKLRSSGMIF